MKRRSSVEVDIELNSLKDAVWRLTTRVFLLEDFITTNFGKNVLFGETENTSPGETENINQQTTSSRQCEKRKTGRREHAVVKKAKNDENSSSENDDEATSSQLDKNQQLLVPKVEMFLDADTIEDTDVDTLDDYFNHDSHPENGDIMDESRNSVQNTSEIIQPRQPVPPRINMASPASKCTQNRLQPTVAHLEEKQDKVVEYKVAYEKVKRSAVWQFFIVDPEDKSKVLCILCDDKPKIYHGLGKKSTTSSMQKHLKQKHRNEFNLNFKEKQSQSEGESQKS